MIPCQLILAQKEMNPQSLAPKDRMTPPQRLKITHTND
jgi:hypothetical protein